MNLASGPASAPDCIFCKIVANQVPAPKLYEDSEVIAIRDLRPQAKDHFLVIPKTHIAALDEAFSEAGSGPTELIGKLFQVGTHLARKHGLLPHGFRSVINTGEHAGQTIFHVHLHILGGEPLGGGFGN